jgi:hypothetical protein
MGTEISAKIIFGIIVEHKPVSGKECCIKSKESNGGSFCSKCGGSLDNVKYSYIGDRYDENRYFISELGYNSNKYIIGKLVQSLRFSEYYAKLKMLSKKEETQIKSDLGRCDCTYYLHRCVS